MKKTIFTQFVKVGNILKIFTEDELLSMLFLKVFKVKKREPNQVKRKCMEKPPEEFK